MATIWSARQPAAATNTATAVSTIPRLNELVLKPLPQRIELLTLPQMQGIELYPSFTFPRMFSAGSLLAGG